jgi:thioredoxin 1
MGGTLTSCGSLATIAELEAALITSYERPLVILKHSDACGLSQRGIGIARDELEAWAQQIGCRVLVVQHSRALSDAIAQRLGVRHETPQVIVVRRARAVWHASHADITSAVVRHTLEVAVADLAN